MKFAQKTDEKSNLQKKYIKNSGQLTKIFNRNICFYPLYFCKKKLEINFRFMILEADPLVLER